MTASEEFQGLKTACIAKTNDYITMLNSVELSDVEDRQVFADMAKVRFNASESAAMLTAFVYKYDSERRQSFTNSKVYYSQSE